MAALLAARGRTRPNLTRGPRTLYLPRPRPDQAELLLDPARFKVAAMGRRWGKSTVGIVAALAGHGPGPPSAPRWPGAIHGARIWWVVPDYPTTGRDRWRDLKRATVAVRTAKNEVERRIDLPGGGSIEVKSADDPDSLRGAGLDGVIVDEASLMAREAWTEALRPALADHGGWALFAFTPKGRRNWTWPLWARGAHPGLPDGPAAAAWQPETSADLELDAELAADLAGYFASFQAPSSDNPLMTPTELALARSDAGSLVYAQEYEARFVVVTGDVIRREWFRRYTPHPDGSVTLEADTPRTVPASALRRFATVDLALSTKTAADWTVAAVLAVTPQRELVVLDVYRRRLEAPDIAPLLGQIRRQHRPAYFAVEAVAYQASIVQAARRLGLPVRPVTPDADKLTRGLGLAARLEAGDLYLPHAAPWLADLEDELASFPNGDHDDQVDALAYAVEAVLSGPARTMTAR